MTNLNKVNEGFNKYCGPAVLSILTGKSTDECAFTISRVNGQYKVKGVLITDLLKAAERLGFTNERMESSGSLFRTLHSIAGADGVYIVMVPSHFVCIEVKEKQIYFCDNHTKEPIPAASSARMMQRVDGIYKIFKKAEPVVEKTKIPEIQATILKVFLVKQNDKVYKAFESTTKAQAYRDKLKSEYEGIELGNYFHIEEIWLELED